MDGRITQPERIVGLGSFVRVVTVERKNKPNYSLTGFIKTAESRFLSEEGAIKPEQYSHLYRHSTDYIHSSPNSFKSTTTTEVTNPLKYLKKFISNIKITIVQNSFWPPPPSSVGFVHNT